MKILDIRHLSPAAQLYVLIFALAYRHYRHWVN